MAVCVPALGAGAQPAEARARIAGWTDPTPHRAFFVPVARRVRLHVLDFGGPASAPALVFLAGLGNTAHAWDTFAPRFTDRFRVIAITRRGFGESSHPSGGYDLATRVRDIRIVMDSLHLSRASLVGHSIAGDELTRFAITYPSRVDKLVYLDAAYDRPALDSLFDLAFTEAPDAPRMPQPTRDEEADPAAYVAFVHRTRGVAIPEADIRARLANDGADETATVAYQAVGSAVERPRYSRIRAPALAVYAVTERVEESEPWVREDSARYEGQQQLLAGSAPIYKFARDEFRREMPRGRVLEIRGGHHWIFLSHPDQVARAMRELLTP